MTCQPLEGALRSEFTLDGRTSSVYTGRGILRMVSHLLRDLTIDHLFVVADSAAPDFGLDDIEDTLDRGTALHVIEVSGGDAAKTLPGLERVLEEALHHATRDSMVCSYGGSATTNLAGLAASLIYRGIPFFHIPTTYLGQADGAIGLKQAVNSATTKNAIGLYTAPLFCMNDTRFMDSLPLDLLREGMVETYKAFIAFEPDRVPLIEDMASRLENEKTGIGMLIHQSARVKTSRTAADPHENGPLYGLEIGHTVAHAIEAASGGRVRHGAAVAVGLRIETRYAWESGSLENPSLLSDIDRVLGDLLHQPPGLPTAVDPGDVIRAIARDNHRTSAGPRLVLLRDYGRTVEPGRIDSALLEDVISDAGQ